MRRIKPLPLSHIDEAASIEAVGVPRGRQSSSPIRSVERISATSACLRMTFWPESARITLLQMKSKSSIWRSNRNSVAAA